MQPRSLAFSMWLWASLLTSCEPQRKATPPSQDTLSTATWASWSKVAAGTYLGQLLPGGRALTADPCVVKDGDLWRMYYTCYAGDEVGGICGATSSDGLSWSRVPHTLGTQSTEGVVLRGRPGRWDENVETCAIIQRDGQYRLFASGYKNPFLFFDRAPAALLEARSDDGEHFERVSEEPVLEPSADGYDADDLFAATLFDDAGTLSAVFTAWCADGYNDGAACPYQPAIQLWGARHVEGQWRKVDAPVLQPRSDVPEMKYGVAEADLLHGADGAWYLFFTAATGDEESRVTMIARGQSPFGPWEIDPQPILRGEPGQGDACGAFAPAVAVDGGRVLLWHIRLDDCAGACPSCNHAACNCDPNWSIGLAETIWPLAQP